MAVFAAAACLALPAGAAGQSSGDEQYADPFGDVPQKQQGGGGGGGGGSQGAGAGAPSAQGAQQAQQPQQQVQQPQAAPSGQQLPRTGLAAGVLLVVGGGLLTGGVVLRRSA